MPFQIVLVLLFSYAISNFSTNVLFSSLSRVSSSPLPTSSSPKSLDRLFSLLSSSFQFSLCPLSFLFKMKQTKYGASKIYPHVELRHAHMLQYIPGLKLLSICFLSFLFSQCLSPGSLASSLIWLLESLNNVLRDT